MKFARYALAFVLLAGFAGFSMRVRSQPPGPSALSDSAIATLERDAGPPSAEEGLVDADARAREALVGDPAVDRQEDQEGESSLEIERPQERRPPPESESSRRSSRRRGRSRYPGPIPTPEEWEPPEGPVRIGLQAGHWKANEAPAELSGIRDNGTRWGNKPEWEANLAIAKQAGALLEELGYEVDILPAVVPPSYRAHLFVSIHSDGSTDPRMSGFRVAAPRRDATGRAAGFAELLEENYGEETGLTRIPTVTHRMQNYYAFNFRRYEHALHPMTIGVIIETGFLTSSRDRQVIVDDPERAGRGIVDAVNAFKETPPPGGPSLGAPRTETKPGG